MEHILFEVDPELKKKVKMEAVRQSISMREFLNGLIVNYFGDSIPEAESIEKNTYECKKCGESWDTHKVDPRVCPFCKSYSWKAPKVRAKSYPHTCQACTHQWENNKENPAACPACKSRAWNGPTPVMIRTDFEKIYRESGLHAAAAAHQSGIALDEFTQLIRRERPVMASHLEKMKEAFKR